MGFSIKELNGQHYKASGIFKYKNRIVLCLQKLKQSERKVAMYLFQEVKHHILKMAVI